jgi:hypothetical protein
VPRIVHCVCCRAILAEAFDGPYLAVCDDCVSHERECQRFPALEDVYDEGNAIDTGSVGDNPMRITP